MEVIELITEQKETNLIKILKNLLFKKFQKKSSDPLELLPPKIVNQIFSYFRGNDFLNFSLVSRKWYRFIAKSPECMEKLQIMIAEPRIGCFQLLTMKDAQLLALQGRKYRHINLSSLERQFLFQHKLVLASFPWRTVTLNNHTFKSKMEFINFLGLIEPYVEDLSLRSVKYGKTYFEIGNTNFTFPCLQRLSIINCYTYAYSDPFKYITTLKQFIVATDALPKHETHVLHELTERVRAIKNLLLKNIHIFYLEMFIHQKDFDLMFIDERFIRNIKFKLQSLFVGRFIQKDNEDLNIVQVNNFVHFLKSQERTLVLLYLEHWLGNATFEYAINDMQLRDFTISNLNPIGAHNESIADLNLFSNDTIENLKIWTQSAKNHYLVEEIIKVCRALRAIEIRTVNQSMLETLVEYNDDIEIIICDFFSAYNPPPRDVMRYLTYMVINISCADNFRDLIGIKDYYSNFELRFLQAARDLRQRLNESGVNYFRY